MISSSMERPETGDRRRETGDGRPETEDGRPSFQKPTERLQLNEELMAELSEPVNCFRRRVTSLTNNVQTSDSFKIGSQRKSKKSMLLGITLPRRSLRNIKDYRCRSSF